MVPPLDFSGPASNHTFDPADNCKDTALYTAAQMCALKSQRWTNWYIADYVYAQSTVYAVCAGIAAFAAVHWLGRLYESKRATSVRQARIVAAARWLAIRQVVVPEWSSVSVGNCIVIGGLGLFLLLLTVAPTPYYWPEVGWAHSPPLGTRTGWMALALLPFQIALSAKRNLIATLTGTSHERLQLFHRWFAFYMLILALIHTFAFVRYNALAKMSVMMWETSYEYWTGVAALVPQAWLTLMSLAPIRNWRYEYFKASHRVVAIIFVVFFFLHCANTLTSWNYFYALAGIFVVSWSVRCALILRNRWYLRSSAYGGEASIRLATPDLLEIRVPQSGLSWHAGQHFFFRFRGVDFFNAWQSHPFTATSVPRPGKTDIVALAKVRKGETRHLANLIGAGGDLRSEVWLDGPYGAGLHKLEHYERVLLLGGGSGLTFISAVANQLVLNERRRNVHIVATCKSASQLRAFIRVLPPREVDDVESKGLGNADAAYVLSTHVTAGRVSEALSKDLEAAESTASTPLHEIKESAAEVNGSRPHLKDIIRQEAGLSSDRRLAVVACGPDSFMQDVASEVAALEWEIASGKSQVKEVYLRTESFHW